MIRRWLQLFESWLLYKKLKRREQESGVTVGLLLKMGVILDYDAKAQTLYLSAGRRGDKEEAAWYEGQRKLIDWITHDGNESSPTRPRDDDGSGRH